MENELTPSACSQPGYRLAGGDDVIEDYLDHLCAPLVGVVPCADRRMLRDDAAFYIGEVANTFVLAGYSARDAARLAVQHYGDSRDLADRLMEACLRTRVGNRFLQRIHPAELSAITWFGLANGCLAFLLQMRVYFTALLANSRPITFGLNPAQIRQIIPRPLPLPQTDPFYFLLLAFLLVAPFVAGFLTGSQAPVRPVRAVYLVQTSLTLYIFVFGFLMLPVRDGLIAAIFELCYWLPVGCVSTAVAAAMTGRRSYRYGRFRRDPSSASTLLALMPFTKRKEP